MKLTKFYCDACGEEEFRRFAVLGLVDLTTDSRDKVCEGVRRFDLCQTCTDKVKALFKGKLEPQCLRKGEEINESRRS